MLRDAIAHLRGFLRPYPAVLPAVAALGTLAALAEGVSIGLMIPFLASLMGAEPNGGGVVAGAMAAYAGLFPDDLRLAAVSGSVIALVCASCAISYGYLRLLSWAATRITHDLRVRLAARYFDDENMFVAAGSQGRQIKAIDSGAYRAGQATISLCLMIASACTTAVFGAMLLLISWPLTLLILLGVGLAWLVVRLFVKRSMTLSRRFETARTTLSDTAMQVILGIRMVRIFGQESRELDRLTAQSEAVRKVEFRLETMRRAMTPLIDGLTVPLLILALVLAFYGGVGPAILLPFLFLVFRLQRYVREFDQSQVRLAADAGAIVEVADLLDRPAAASQPGGGAAIGRLQKEIVFDDVAFSHRGVEDGGAGVSGISLSIPRGETLGIVGASGSGKSTLVNLLVGLYRPASGEIRVDGVPLDRIDPAAWRARIGFAGQDAELRSGTIAENIAYGRPDASMDEIRDAAEQAHISDFIARLPDGLDSMVGARGLQLSGGERQRIALARALLRRPDILILDEATNAVDNTSEAIIRATMEGLKGRLTMIVIAHRLSSIGHADRVVVMEAGRIVETGPPADLMAAEGTFAELRRLETAAQ